MNDTEREKLKEHNQRVREAAKKLPTKGLRDSFKALAYRADARTSNAKGCTVSGISMETIARLSARNGYPRSKRQLWADLKTFEEYGLAIREAGERSGRRQAPSLIMLRFDETLPADYLKPKQDAYKSSEPRTRTPKTKHEPNELPHHCPACLALYPSELAAYIDGDLTDNDIGHIYTVHRNSICTL